MEQDNLNEMNLQERYSLATGRIHEICSEGTVPAPFCDFFQKTARFLVQMEDLKNCLDSGAAQDYTLRQWEQLNNALYYDILPEQYGMSYANPAYAVGTLGETHGRLLSFLYTELRGIIVYAFEHRMEETVVLCELFIEIYNSFEQEELPSGEDIRQIIYWFVSDYSELFAAYRTRSAIDPSFDFATRIIMDSDLSDPRYLYRYGEYVSENERKTAEYLNRLSEQEIEAMASTFTEGYRIGFAVAGKDLSIKKTVNIHYHLGFERMIRAAIKNFEKMGLSPVIYRAAVSTINKSGHRRIGYTGAAANLQYDYDHRADNAIYLDKRFLERKLSALRGIYEANRTLAKEHAGPAVLEVFGETPFVPETKPEAYQLSEKQQKLMAWMQNELAQLSNQYIPETERSFTIIAFPLPEIGPNYEEIFRETVRINTLDYKLYQEIQQTLIDALDQGEAVHIKGRDGNRTDLMVALTTLSDPKRESLFENCVADVNIPVGEVFTSPRLAGTNGTLHVKQVYLNELKYVDLEVKFKDGMVKDYSCANFPTEEENRSYFKENVLFHHETLPIGEFAIGTNTTAYMMAEKYQIADKLPILIAEKMGPHFALGDTCYGREEDTPTYNPDGKRIIAHDNEVSLLRKEDPSKAYFNCHTDITIPYEEIGYIEVVCADGRRITLLRDGRFVLPGTEKLNEPFAS